MDTKPSNGTIRRGDHNKCRRLMRTPIHPAILFGATRFHSTQGGPHDGSSTPNSSFCRFASSTYPCMASSFDRSLTASHASHLDRSVNENIPGRSVSHLPSVTCL